MLLETGISGMLCHIRLSTCHLAGFEFAQLADTILLEISHIGTYIGLDGGTHRLFYHRGLNK